MLDFAMNTLLMNRLCERTRQNPGWEIRGQLR